MSYGTNNKANDFRRIEQDLKADAIDISKPILLCGNEGYLIDFYEKKLTGNFIGTVFPDINLNLFYGDESTDDDIMGSCDTFPMIGDYRLVISRNNKGFTEASNGSKSSTDGAKKKQLLIDYVSDIPESAILIFTTRTINKNTALFKELKKSGVIYEFNTLTEEDLTMFIKKRFAANNLSISKEVLNTFIYTSTYLEKETDKDLFSLSGEIEKLNTFVVSEGRTEVTLHDLNECMETTLQSDVFAMLDAISSNRKADAINLLENSMAQGGNIFGLTALFTGHFEFMLGYKEMSEANYPKAKMMEILGSKSDFRLNKLGRFSEKFTKEELMNILHRFYCIEKDIKSGNINENIALTVLLSEIQ